MTNYGLFLLKNWEDTVKQLTLRNIEKFENPPNRIGMSSELSEEEEDYYWSIL